MFFRGKSWGYYAAVGLLMAALVSGLRGAIVTADWLGGNNWWTAANHWEFVPAGDHEFPDNVGQDRFRVTIGSGIVVLDVEPEISDLTLDGGSLTGDEDIRVLTFFQWFSGTLAGNGELVADTQISLPGSGAKGLGGGRVIRNRGLFTISGSGTLIGAENARIINEGSLRLTATANFEAPGPITIDNEDEFEKTGGGNVVWAPVFNNRGRFRVVSGGIALTGGGVHEDDFEVGTGTSLYFGGGVHTFTEPVEISGRGLAVVSGGTVDFQEPVSGENLAQNGGLIMGDGDLTATESFRWLAGAQTGSGGFIIDDDCLLSLETPSGKTLGPERVMTVHGDVRVVNTGALTVWDEAGIRVEDSGQFTIEAPFSILPDGSAEPVFSNKGELVADLPGEAVIAIRLENTGAITGASGRLALTAGGLNSGTADLAVSTVLEFRDGDFLWNTGTAFSGLGTVEITGTTVEAVGAASVDGLALTSGELRSSGGVTVERLFTWTGGELVADGVFTIGANGVFEPTATGLSLSGNAGLNTTGQMWPAANASILTGGGLPWENSGLVDLATGFLFDGAALGGTRATLTNTGTVRMAEAGTAHLRVNYAGDGRIEADAGEIAFTGEAFTASGEIALAGGTVSSTAPAVIGGSGSLRGGGALVANVALTGGLEPTGSDTIAITGDLDLMAPAVTTVTLTGTGTSGRVAVTGTATLGGQLTVVLAAGFSPGTDDRFEFLIAGNVTDAFGTVVLPESLGARARVEYGATTVAIVLEEISTYAAWKAVEFTPSEQAQPAISGPLADPDADGMPNLFEYAFALSPKSAESDPVTVTLVAGDDAAFRLRFPWRRAAEDTAWSVEATDDLPPVWDGATATVVATEPGETAVTDQLTVAVDGPAEDMGFFRLVVTLTDSP